MEPVNLLPPEMQTAIYAFIAVIAANAVRWVWRWVQAYADKTPNKLDDKIVAAVQKGIMKVVEEEYEDDDKTG